MSIIRETAEYSKYNSARNQVLLFQLHNREKIKDLIFKIKCGGKINIVIVGLFRGQFGLENVLNEIRSKYNDIFDIKIFLMSYFAGRFNSDNHEYEQLLITRKYLEGQGYSVYMGYDENYNPIDIDILSPDIVMYSNHYMGEHTLHYSAPHHWSYQYLTCYFNYGLNVVNTFNYHYNHYNVVTNWINFVHTKHDIKMARFKSVTKGYNCVLSGYPKLDSYQNGSGSKCEYDSIDSPIVIYAPHWSILKEDSRLAGTFDKYYDVFINLIEEYPEITFVFRPHPSLRNWVRVFKEEGKLDIDFDNYVKKINSYPNCIYYLEDDYIGLFKKSTCLITDCGSFIGEYLPSGNPCIYIFNANKFNQIANYSELGRKILSSYYIVDNEYALRETFKNVVLNQQDFKQLDRLKILDEEFINVGTASKVVIETILSRLGLAEKII